MKNLLFILCIVTSSLCKADSWIRKADFPGPSRRFAFGFTIGDRAYVGGGVDYNDLWEYNPVADTWIKKTDPPFTINTSTQIGFAIGAHGYVFTDFANQFWEYTPATDSWLRKADLPGGFRGTDGSFVIGNKGYIGGGILFSTSMPDSNYYCYDPLTNVWSGIAKLPMTFHESTGFTANGKGYLTGFLIASGSSFITSPIVLQYNPIANSWTKKADFPGPPRSEGSTFDIGNIAYLSLGAEVGGSGSLKDLWQYNAYTDSWTQKVSIPCINPKDEEPAFVLNNKAYVVFGADVYPDREVWEYTPDSLGLQVASTIASQQIDLYPNPTKTKLYLKARNNISDVTVSDLLGQTIFTNTYNATQVQIDVANLPQGIYLIKINNTEVRKFIKE